MQKIIRNVKDFRITSVQMPAPQKILMVKPSYFDVEYSINPHMQDASGKLNQINKPLAMSQWTNLKKTYENLGLTVSVLDGVEHLPDMVFCANQSFPYLNTKGEKCLILSNMHSDIRQKEVTHFATFFQKEGYAVSTIAPRDAKHFFESTGDAILVPGSHLILGGHGFRTDATIYETLAQKTGAQIAIFKLVNPRFYHLDTCLSVLNQTSALYCPDAFDTEGIELLQKIFPHLIEVPVNEADSPGFACNAHCPDQKHVILQKGSLVTNEKLLQKSFIPIELDTSEFIKAGGSVFCMKLMFY